MTKKKKVEEEAPEEESEETQETPEEPQTISKEDVEKMLQALDEKYQTSLKELKQLYEELLDNLPEEEETEEKLEVPSFEEWLKAIFELMKDEEQRKKKYPYYPFLFRCIPIYPYYPYPYKKYPYKKYPVKGKEEEEPEEETAEGQGVQESVDPHRSELEKIAESLKNPATIREQWEPRCVDVTTKEITGHLRDHCYVTQIIRGKQGDVVTIPYVKDFDFDVLATVGGTLPERTGLYGTITTTLKEAGAYTQIGYADIEKIDADLLEKLEEKARTASLRAEDKVILDALMAETGVPEIDKSTATVAFDADWVAEAIAELQKQGKEVQPGDCVLVLSPAMHEAFMKDIMAAMALSFARPDIVQKGRITEFLGVQVVIAGYLPEWQTNDVSAYLIMKRRAVALAPKRDMLFETEKDTVARKVKMTFSHTFGVAIIDAKAAVEIKTGLSYTGT